MISGFVGAVPPGRFNVIDMAFDGKGEWKDCIDIGKKPIVGTHFIWTRLHIKQVLKLMSHMKGKPVKSTLHKYYLYEYNTQHGSPKREQKY